MSQAKFRPVVLGDAMLDVTEWLGDVRQSPEHPHTLAARSTGRVTYAPGGAANVAANVASLCPDAYPLLIAGGSGDYDPDVGDRLAAQLDEGRVQHMLGHQPGTALSVKRRFRSPDGLLLRVDRDPVPGEADWSGAFAALTDGTFGPMRRCLRDRLAERDRVGAVLLVNYNKGFLRYDVVDAVLDDCRAANALVVADPGKDPRDWSRYTLHAGSVIKVNDVQARAALRSGRPAPADVREACDLAVACARVAWSSPACKAAALWVTCGPHGSVLIPGDALTEAGAPPVLHVPARAAAAVDVCGAGDTALAAFAVAMFGAPRTWAAFTTAAAFAAQAAAIAVGTAGTAAVTLAAVESAFKGPPR